MWCSNHLCVCNQWSETYFQGLPLAREPGRTKCPGPVPPKRSPATLQASCSSWGKTLHCAGPQIPRIEKWRWQQPPSHNFCGQEMSYVLPTFTERQNLLRRSKWILICTLRWMQIQRAMPLAIECQPVPTLQSSDFPKSSLQSCNSHFPVRKAELREGKTVSHSHTAIRWSLSLSRPRAQALTPGQSKPQVVWQVWTCHQSSKSQTKWWRGRPHRSASQSIKSGVVTNKVTGALGSLTRNPTSTAFNITLFRILLFGHLISKPFNFMCSLNIYIYEDVFQVSPIQLQIFFICWLVCHNATHSCKSRISWGQHPVTQDYP